ncbi:MAG: hypothetical protein GY853_05720 [PVC group bacterium]|nr:hypothetical protein [PVC group bacterium]
MTKISTELDSPWKDILELYFAAFIQFFFPQLHKLIDWNSDYEFMDKELQKVLKDAKTKQRFTDKLAKVWLKNGKTTVLYIHVEVQGQYDEDFAKRMFIYNYRLFDRYDTPVISLAILGDDNSIWRPQSYSYGLAGFNMSCRFPIVKLLDYQKNQVKWKALQKSINPFSTVVQVHLKALETRQSSQQRLYWKKELFKTLYEAKYSMQEILDLFRFMDWVLALPEKLEQQFNDFVIQHEEEEQMPYITSIERLGIEKGRNEGRKEGRNEGRNEGFQQGALQQSQQSVIEALKFRFKRVPQSLAKMIKAIEDAKLLSNLHREAVLTDSLKTFKQKLEQSA